MPPDFPPDIEIYEYLNQPSSEGGFVIVAMFIIFAFLGEALKSKK